MLYCLKKKWWDWIFFPDEYFCSGYIWTFLIIFNCWIYTFSIMGYCYFVSLFFNLFNNNNTWSMYALFVHFYIIFILFLRKLLWIRHSSESEEKRGYLKERFRYLSTPHFEIISYLFDKNKCSQNSLNFLWIFYLKTEFTQQII